MKNIFYSASGSQFVATEPVKNLKIGKKKKHVFMAKINFAYRFCVRRDILRETDFLPSVIFYYRKSLFKIIFG